MTIRQMKPNILVIMTEQRCGDCLGIDEHPVLQTPNIDHIAYGGVRFYHMLQDQTVCLLQ